MRDQSVQIQKQFIYQLFGLTTERMIPVGILIVFWNVSFIGTRTLRSQINSLIRKRSYQKNKKIQIYYEKHLDND
ncbi:hypothetical protein A6E22_00250 [Bacillus cereus]|nr:hypothetical protein A6E22_00250 [Bacillus cereus]